MRKGFGFLLCAVMLLMIMAFVVSPPDVKAGPVSGSQVLLNMKFLSTGVPTQGAGVLQTGELSTLSASVATATLTEVVAAPASGSTYVRSVLVEKSTGAGGTVTIKYGTGANCGTGTTTILGPITNPPIGVIPLGIAVPAAKALCVQTDAATTIVRALTA